MAAFNGMNNFPELRGSIDAEVILGVKGPPGPQGIPGKDYVLTEADKADIAAMAAKLVHAPDSGGNVDLEKLKSTFVSVSSQQFTEEQKAQARENIGAVSAFDPTAYGLPVLYLTGDVSAMTKENAVTLNYAYDGRTGTASVKWQGSSSLSYPKKNYTITFDNAFEAKSGWGSHDKYCLKANWVDASQMRNIFCAKLWGLMVKSRANVDPRLSALPNGGAIDGFPVIVVFNGEPAGLYTMNIPKDGWMFGMTGVNANEAIMCAEASGFYNPVVGDETDFEVEYTGADTDESKAAAIKSLNNLVTVCNSVASADDLPALEALVDIQSLVDYYILSAVICHRDGITKNYILATYDGVKWFISAYDMDATFGNKWDGSGFYWYNDYPTFANLCDNNKLMWIVRTYYLADLKARWAQLKSWDIGQGNFTAEVTNLAHQFPVKAYMLDWNLWSTVPGTNANNTEQIKDYHWLRMPMIDWELSQLT